MRRSLIAPFIALATFAATPVALAAEIKVLTAGAFKPIVLALAADFEARTAHKLIIDNDTAGGLTRRIAAGEAFDLLIVTNAVLQDLAKSGRIVPASATRLARTAVGVAVKQGDPKPDIASVEAFKAALLAARKVAYIDPAAGGTSGIYFSGLLDRLGIGPAVKAKAVLVTGGLVAQKLVTGEADLAVHQISEILAVEGAVLVGPLPAEIQSYTIYSGGLASTAAQPEAARAFLDALAGEAGDRVLAARGMDRPPRD